MTIARLKLPVYGLLQNKYVGPDMTEMCNYFRKF